MKLRVLVATNPEGNRRVADILAGHELVFVQTLEEAEAVLASQSFDLAAVGTRFDESRMFELVRHIRSSDRMAGICVVCFRGILFRRASDKVLVEGLSLGCHALGAVFHDFISYPDDAAGNMAIRKIFESCAISHREGMA